MWIPKKKIKQADQRHLWKVKFMWPARLFGEHYCHNPTPPIQR